MGYCLAVKGTEFAYSSIDIRLESAHHALSVSHSSLAHPALGSSTGVYHHVLMENQQTIPQREPFKDIESFTVVQNGVRVAFKNLFWRVTEARPLAPNKPNSGLRQEYVMYWLR